MSPMGKPEPSTSTPEEHPQHGAEKGGGHRSTGARPSLWRRAGKAVFAVPRPLHALLLVICLMLGVALVTQVRAQQEDPLETMGEQDLVLLLDELTSRADELRTERSDLNSQLMELEDSASQREAADKAAAQARIQSQINAGTVPVHGEGVVLTVRDPQGQVPVEYFILTLGELRNAGSEAIALNGVRLTSRTWFSSGEDGIIVDSTPITSPYTWQVIGDSQTIAPALEISAGAASQMRARGAQVEVEPAQDVVIDAVVQPSSPRFAQVE